jgi:GTP-binding protein
VKTHQLNTLVEQISRDASPAEPGPAARAHSLRGADQRGAATFVFFTNVATSFHFSYERYLVNQLREAFGFEARPIRIQVRSAQAETGRSG